MRILKTMDKSRENSIMNSTYLQLASKIIFANIFLPIPSTIVFSPSFKKLIKVVLEDMCLTQNYPVRSRLDYNSD